MLSPDPFRATINFSVGSRRKTTLDQWLVAGQGCNHITVHFFAQKASQTTVLHTETEESTLNAQINHHRLGMSCFIYFCGCFSQQLDEQEILNACQLINVVTSTAG
ncbi:hypothetical protein XENOCAPTIV_001833 [Xenoophorus captivus]|uniref:Uncharacterized protein n=1 Tax=Xenoophorus captivus TaxID=1517983 RepID=A0ABV0SCQ9_9TELE